jgi:hypothetical protein
MWLDMMNPYAKFLTDLLQTPELIGKQHRQHGNSEGPVPFTRNGFQKFGPTKIVPIRIGRMRPDRHPMPDGTFYRQPHRVIIPGMCAASNIG